MERRLAAILAADVVAFSRLVHQDEVGIAEAMRNLHASVLPLVARYGGRVIDMAGDSILAEFQSVASAVQCARAIQDVLPTVNVGTPADRHLTLRIGVHQGDIVIDGERAYGNGINVAARLQAVAEPGGIAISGRVHEDVAGKFGLEWRDDGEHDLKNIGAPVRIFHLLSGQEARTSATKPAPLPSIGVLPFDGAGAADDTLFSDGITEDIITGLARFRSLFVVARNSSFAFRGKAASLAEIGRQLGVAYLLQGSVRRAGTRVRISAQLLEASSGSHVWAERYDREFDDIFDVQDEVSTKLVSTLVGRIEDAKLHHSARKAPSSLDAYECLLRGISHFRSYAPDANRRAVEFFDAAIALDPFYARAHAFRALAHISLHGYGAASRAEIGTASAAAQRAVDLDQQDGSCHRALGHVLLYARDYDRAERHARLAVELNPNDADAAIGLGYLLVQRGRAPEALGWIEKATRLNPLHPPWYHAQIAAALYHMGRFAESAQAVRRLPDSQGWDFRLAACYGQLGDETLAPAAAAAVLAHDPTFTIEAFMSQILLEHETDRELLREGLAKAGLPRFAAVR